MRSITPLLLLFLGVAYAIPTVQYNYQNRKVLSDDQSPLFEIRWTLDAKNLRVAIIAETEEWVSLGFSADGTLQRSDGIIARIGQLGPQVEDYFVPSDNSCPETICADKVLGCKDNIADVRGKRVGKYVIVEYTRPIQASDNCDQSISAATGQSHFVHWAVGAREVLGMNVRTERFSFASSNKKRSSTVEMIVLGGRELNMTILGNWFGHLTLEYWKNVDSSVVELDGNYNRQTFCSLNPDAVQLAGAELVTMNGYSIYAPKTKRSIKGTYIEWEIEDVQISAGYCTAPTTSPVVCSQYNPNWPEAATEFIPLVISETSLADTWDQVCDSVTNYDFVEQCPPSACWAVPVNEWPNSKYPDAAATTATGLYALTDKYTSVEGQTNSNTFTREHVRNVFNREITDLEPGYREYPGNVYPVNVTDIWCGNKPWRTDIDPKPALKPCGTVKVATASVSTSEPVQQDDLTYAIATYVNVEPSTVQAGYSTKQLGNDTDISISILDYGMRSGRSSLDLLKLALSYNSTALQRFGIPGSVSVGDITWEEVKVTEEGLSSASSVGISMILISALLVCALFF